MELIIGREAGASRLRISINNQDRFWGNVYYGGSCKW